MKHEAQKVSNSISRELAAGQLHPDALESLANILEQDSLKGVTRDDLEWLRLLAKVQSNLNKCETAAEFGWIDGNHHTWGFSYQKAKELYTRMERNQAIQKIEYFLGGSARVTASDLREIQRFLVLQTKQRLRAMDMLAPQPWSKSRAVSAWLASHTSKIMVGVLIAVVSATLLAYLNLQF